MEKQSECSVLKQFYKDGHLATEMSDETTIEVHKFVTEPATVSVEYGLTMNLGNFESARIAVHLTVPAYREEVDGAYDYARKFVESRVATEVAEIRQSRKASLNG